MRCAADVGRDPLRHSREGDERETETETERESDPPSLHAYARRLPSHEQRRRTELPAARS